MSTLSIRDIVAEGVTAHPAAEDVAALYHLLAAETAEVVGPACLQPLGVFLRDNAGAVAGGLWGTTFYSWLSINALLVPATCRGQGMGTSLVRMAEQVARDRHCIGAQVSAYDFQAAGFYQRLGFTICGVLEDNPPGYRSYQLCKRLA